MILQARIANHFFCNDSLTLSPPCQFRPLLVPIVAARRNVLRVSQVLRQKIRLCWYYRTDISCRLRFSEMRSEIVFHTGRPPPTQPTAYLLNDCGLFLSHLTSSSQCLEKASGISDIAAQWNRTITAWQHVHRTIEICELSGRTACDASQLAQKRLWDSLHQVMHRTPQTSPTRTPRGRRGGRSITEWNRAQVGGHCSQDSIDPAIASSGSTKAWQEPMNFRFLPATPPPRQSSHFLPDPSTQTSFRLEYHRFLTSLPLHRLKCRAITVHL
jgi:hypothetical protein